MKNSIYICFAINLLGTIAPVGCMQKTIRQAHASKINDETPVVVSSLLYSFMRGTFEAKEDGSLFFDHYKDSTIIYQYTIKDFHTALGSYHTTISYLRTGFQQLPIQQKNPFCPILIPQNENEKSQIAMLEFGDFMNNDDITENPQKNEIMEKRDALKKALMAIETQKDIKAVAIRINEANQARSKNLVK